MCVLLAVYMYVSVCVCVCVSPTKWNVFLYTLLSPSGLAGHVCLNIWCQ